MIIVEPLWIEMDIEEKFCNFASRNGFSSPVDRHCVSVRAFYVRAVGVYSFIYERHNFAQCAASCRLTSRLEVLQ